jgi:quinol monooxygenase YgiN
MIYELRQYTLHPGTRDTLIDLFERHFVPGQEAVGIRVPAWFRDLGDPNRFIWFRAFTDMPARAEALAAFYDGPIWHEHRAAANATMIDSDDVLLLRPAGPTPPFAATPTGVQALTVQSFPSGVPLKPSAPNAVALLATEYADNTFPRLPIRTGEHVLVTLEPEAGAAPPPDDAVRTRLERP